MTKPALTGRPSSGIPVARQDEISSGQVSSGELPPGGAPSSYAPDSTSGRAARNPVLRALGDFGRLLSRKITAVLPSFARFAAQQDAGTGLPAEAVRRLDAQREANQPQWTESERRLEALIDQLTAQEPAGRAAGSLAACQDLTAALRECLKPGTPAGAGKVSMAMALQYLLGQPAVTATLQRCAPALRRVLQDAEMRSLLTVLSTAAEQAEAAGLPELEAQIGEARQTLEILAAAADAGRAESGSDRAPKADPAKLQPATLEILARSLSIALGPGGEVHLTAGKCAEPFVEGMRGRIENSASKDEQSTILIGATQVPQQLWKDGERALTLMTFLSQDGEPLVDKAGWSKLTVDEQKERVAEGYRKLRQQYPDHPEQAHALLLQAHQGIFAGLHEALLFGYEHSPVQLDGRPGRLTVPTTNTREISTFRFVTGEDQVPRLEVSYEVQGGRFQLPDDQDPMNSRDTYLDLARSRAKFSFAVQMGDDGCPRMVGQPAYDVHLVRSPIQREYPLPKAAHLLERNTAQLYSDLIEFAEERHPEAVPALRALQLAAAATNELEEPKKLQHLENLYDRHLREGAAQPLIPPDPADPLEKRAPQALERAAESLRDFIRDYRQAVAAAPTAQAADEIRRRMIEAAPAKIEPLVRELLPTAGKLLPGFIEKLKAEAASSAAFINTGDLES